MTSNITNFSQNIDTNFPVQGQDNPSQGFRDNFAQIVLAFDTASTEISNVQAQVTTLSLDGFIGPQGPAGPSGLKGDTGTQGLQGPIGPKGDIAAINVASDVNLGIVLIPPVDVSGISNNSGTIGLAVASNTQLGGVKVDGTTISSNNGVIGLSPLLTFQHLTVTTATISKLEVQQTSTFDNTVTIASLINSTSSINGALIVAGGVGINKDLYVGGTGYFSNDLYVNGVKTDFTSYITADSGLTIYLSTGTLTPSSATGSGIKIGPNHSTPFIDWVFNGYSNSQAKWLTQGGIDILNTVESQSTLTGALNVAGGVGIQKNLNVGGNITANNMFIGPWPVSTSSSTLKLAGILSGIPLSFTVERSGVGAVGQIMSYGNGSATGKGLVMPYSGNIVLAVLTAINITGTVTVTAFYNGAIVPGYSLTGTANGSDVTQQISTSLSFNAGDHVGWYISSAPTAANCYEINYYVVYD